MDVHLGDVVAEDCGGLPVTGPAMPLLVVAETDVVPVDYITVRFSCRSFGESTMKPTELDVPADWVVVSALDPHPRVPSRRHAALTRGPAGAVVDLKQRKERRHAADCSFVV